MTFHHCYFWWLTDFLWLLCSQRRNTNKQMCAIIFISVIDSCTVCKQKQLQRHYKLLSHNFHRNSVKTYFISIIHDSWWLIVPSEIKVLKLCQSWNLHPLIYSTPFKAWNMSSHYTSHPNASICYGVTLAFFSPALFSNYVY